MKVLEISYKSYGLLFSNSPKNKSRCDPRLRFFEWEGDRSGTWVPARSTITDVLHDHRRFLGSVPNLPFYYKLDSPSWRQWSYYVILLRLLSQDIINCKRYGPPKSTNFGENGRSKMQRCKEHGSGRKKCNQPDRSDDISHTTYYFQIWKSTLHVSGK